MSQGSRFCHRCGAALPSGATFCPSCGTAIAGAQAVPQAQVPPSGPAPPRYQRHEKQEKHEKNEKGEKQEKGKGGDLAGALTGGLILIFLGVLLYFAAVGTTSINYGNFWQYFIIGVGVILIVQGIVRYGEKGIPYLGSFVGGAVMIIIGLAFISSANANFWPLILVVLGAAAIFSALTSRRKAPAP